MKKFFTAVLSLLTLGMCFVGCTKKDTDPIKDEQEKTIVAIDCKATEVFTAFSQTKTFFVTHTINFAEISAPEGWTVSYSNDSVKVTSPASASTVQSGTITIKGEDNIGRMATATMKVVRREADASEFGDETFRDYLVANFDSNKDGVLSTAELEAITKVDIRGKELTPNFRYQGLGITSLEGINALPALQELYCSNNSLGKLDLSANTELKVLHCYFTGLTELDLANNTKLTEVYCFYNNLTTLDLSKCTGITKLACQNNKLTAVTFPATSHLTEINIANNAFTTFNAKQHTALTSLVCNNNQLSTLDITSCPKIATLNCSNNKLAALDLSKATALVSLNCIKNSITSLNTSKCAVLEDVSANNNAIASADFSGCKKLQSIKVGDNALATITLTDTPALTYLGCWNNKLTAIDLAGCPALQKIACNGNNITNIDMHVAKNLTFVQCFGNPIVSVNLQGLKKLDALYLVDGTNSVGKSVKTSTNTTTGVVTPLDTTYFVKVTGTPLTALSLNVAETKFKHIYVTSNEKLASVDLSANTDATYFDLSKNALTSINMSANTKADTLFLNDNKIAALNLKGLNTMVYVTLFNNSQLNELNLEGQTNTLKYLYIKDKSTNAIAWSAKGEGSFTMSSNASISGLKLNTKGTKILNIYCNSNAKLNTIDLSDCPQVTVLQCHSNNLSTLDLTNLTALTTLTCSNNALTAIHLGANRVLSTVDVSKNKLTTFDAEQLTALNKLTISSNYLTVLDLSHNAALSNKGTVDCTENPNLTSVILPSAASGKATVIKGDQTVVSYL